MRQLHCFKVNYLPPQHTSRVSNKLYTHAPRSDLPATLLRLDLKHQVTAPWSKAQRARPGVPGLLSSAPAPGELLSARALRPDTKS